VNRDLTEAYVWNAVALSAGLSGRTKDEVLHRLALLSARLTDKELFQAQIVSAQRSALVRLRMPSSPDSRRDFSGMK